MLPSKCLNGSADAPPIVTDEVRVPLPPKVTVRISELMVSPGTLKLLGRAILADSIGFAAPTPEV